MRYILWLLKFALFVVVLSFAVKNTDTVTVHYYLGYDWQAPLVVVALVFFCAGAVISILAGLFRQVRLQREISTLKSEVRKQERIRDTAPPVDAA